jgi:hypothetical protein
MHHAKTRAGGSYVLLGMGRRSAAPLPAQAACRFTMRPHVIQLLACTCKSKGMPVEYDGSSYYC